MKLINGALWIKVHVSVVKVTIFSTNLGFKKPKQKNPPSNQIVFSIGKITFLHITCL